MSGCAGELQLHPCAVKTARESVSLTPPLLSSSCRVLYSGWGENGTYLKLITRWSGEAYKNIFTLSSSSTIQSLVIGETRLLGADAPGERYGKL